MDNKKKKTLGVVTNAIVIVILVFVALITLSIILSYGKGYTSLFGNAYVAVESDSMEGVYGENYPYEVKGFKKGDLIRVHILSDEEKGDLQVGDVITFYQVINGERVLNTHRIIIRNFETAGIVYVTQGDKAAVVGAEGYATERVTQSNIVGIYTGHRFSGVGKCVDFFHSSAGFFVCVVLPSLLIVGYFAVNLFLTVKSVKKVSTEEAAADEKQKMREELLKELREEGKIKEEAPEEGSSDKETK